MCFNNYHYNCRQTYFDRIRVLFRRLDVQGDRCIWMNILFSVTLKSDKTTSHMFPPGRIGNHTNIRNSFNKIEPEIKVLS